MTNTLRFYADVVEEGASELDLNSWIVLNREQNEGRLEAEHAQKCAERLSKILARGQLQ